MVKVCAGCLQGEKATPGSHGACHVISVITAAAATASPVLGESTCVRYSLARRWQRQLYSLRFVTAAGGSCSSDFRNDPDIDASQY